MKNFSNSVIGGIFIAIGGTAYLMANNTLLGSILFAIGLISIITLNAKLFTGVMANRLHFANIPLYITVYVGNFLGILISCQMLKLTRIYDELRAKSLTIVETKFADSAISLIVLGIFCGICITIAVLLVQRLEHKMVWIVILPVVVFILCSFEHCIADMYYLCISGKILSFQGFRLLTYVTIGNVIGGPIIPLLQENSSQHSS